MENIKRSLILAGGGMRVSYQAGVLKAMLESGLKFFHVDGTSGGIINLAMLLSGLPPDEMCQRWRSLDVKRFASLLPLKDYIKLTDTPALGDSDGIRDYVFPHLGISIDNINRANFITGTFNVCNFTQKTSQSIEHRLVKLNHLVAGISLPIFMPPVEQDGELYIDNVWIKDANLIEAVKRGAEEIWLIWCIGNTEEYKAGVFNQYVHMIEMSANGVLFEEFDRIQQINQSIKRGHSPYGQSNPIRLHVIKPQHPLPIDPDLYFGKIDNACLIEMGYSDAVSYLNLKNRIGIDWGSQATKMLKEHPGIRFSESFSGSVNFFKPSRHFPKECELSLYITAHIDDLENFIEHPDLGGRITGRIEWKEQKISSLISHGSLTIQSLSTDLKSKKINYQFIFFHEGDTYQFYGFKQLKDDPGFDFFDDITTLQIQLYQGQRDTEPPIATGVLTASLSQFKNMIRGIQATSVESISTKGKNVAKFAKFLLGQMYETYI